MLADQARELVATLFKAFPQTEPRVGTTEVYEKALRGLSYDSTKDVVDELCIDSTRLPYIAEIRRAVVVRENPLPTALEAWESLISPRAEGQTRELHPLTIRVRDFFGGTFNLKNSESPTIMRNQFLKTYDELREEELSRANIGAFRNAA